MEDRHPFFFLPALLFGALFSTGFAQDTLDLYPDHPGSLICWTETRSEPRPLKIHFIRVDLSCMGLEIITLPGTDPDGDGPAESTLTLPEDLFKRYEALAAINANAFSGLPGTEKDIRGWYRNRPVDMHGMVVNGGIVISPPEKGRTAFWLDSIRQPHIGDPKPGEKPWQAISDWSTTLIEDGRIIPDSTTITLHPRSAIGFDDSGKWLLMVVVDGRQPRYSEGISLFELARLFYSKGCTRATNLDGGGSSIMLIRNPDGTPKTINRPSGIGHRPVPVMLGIRTTTAH